MAFDYSGAKAAGYSDDEIAPYLKSAAEKAVAAGYAPAEVRARLVKTGVHPDLAFDVTATTEERVAKAVTPAASAVAGQLGAVRDALTPDPGALMRRIKAGSATPIPGLKTISDLQERGPENAERVAQEVAAAGYPRLAVPAGVLAGAPTTLSQVLTPVPGTVGGAVEMGAAVGAGGLATEFAGMVPAGRFNPKIPPMDYAANVLRRKMGLGGPSSLVPADPAASLAEGKIGLAQAARVSPDVFQAELAKRGLAPAAAVPPPPASNLDVAPVPGTLAGDMPGVNVPRQVPGAPLGAGVDQVTPENLLEGFRPDAQPALFSPAMATAAGGETSPAGAFPGGSSPPESPTADGAPAPGLSRSPAAPGTVGTPPPIGEQASPESIPARSLPVKGVGGTDAVLDEGSRVFKVPVDDPHLPARIVDKARTQGAMLAPELERLAGTKATPKQLAWGRDALAREIERLRAFGVEAPESFHEAVAAADRQLLKPPAERGMKEIAGDLLSNREIEKLTGRKAYQLSPEEYRRVAPNNPIADHRDAVFNGMVHGGGVPPHVAARYPELESELQEAAYNRENAPLEQEKKTALDVAREMGINKRLYEKYYKGDLKSIEDSPAGRFIIRENGRPLDDLAEHAWELGIIPDHDLNAYQDKLNDDIRSSNYGSSERGSVIAGGAAPAEAPEFLRSYQDRIHDYLPTRTSLGETLRRLHVEIFNKDAPIERLRDLYPGAISQDKDLALLLARARGAGGIAEANLHVGTFKMLPDGNLVKTGEPLQAVLRDMGDAWKDVETYLVAQRDMDLSRRGIQGLDAAKASKVASFLEQKHGAQKLASVVARYVAWEDRAFLQPMLDLGIKPKEVIDSIRESGKSYVVFHRWFDDLENSGHVGGGNPLKTISGSERDIASPFQTVIKQNLSFTRFFERVRVGQAIYAMKDLPGLEGEVTVVDKAGANTISVPVDGAPVIMKVSPAVKAAYDDYTPAAGKTLLNILSLPAKMQRAGVTLDPRFSLLSHPLRYQVEASLLAKHGFIPGLDYVRGLAAVIGKSRSYDEWMAAGGDQTAITAIDAAETPRKLQDVMGGARPSEWSPLYMLQKIREIDDKGVRLGIYIRARSAGESALEAAAQARDGVVDPAVHGAATGAASKISPFFNIHLQSEARLLREMRDNPARFASRLAPYIAATAALWYLNKDDREYQEKPDWQKMVFWFVPAGKDALGRTRFLPIPKPFVPGTLFMGGTEALLNHMYKGDAKIVTHWVEQTLGELLPLPIPPFVRLPGELLAGDRGYSFFEKRPIVPAGTADMLPKDRSSEYTSTIGRKVGATMGVSPAKVDYSIGTVGGTLGRRLLEASNTYLDPAGSPKRPETPFTPFARPSVGSNSESVNRFYDYLSQMEQSRNSLNANMRGVKVDAGPMLGLFRSAQQQIDEIRRYEKIVTASRMDPAAKTALLQRYDGVVTNLAHTMVKTYEGQAASGRQVR